eukprot:UN03325
MLRKGSKDYIEPAAAEVKIITMHGDYENMEKQEIHKEYINLLRNMTGLQEIYGSHVFPCVRLSRLKKKEDGPNQTNLVLASIGEGGITMVDPFGHNDPTYYSLYR